MTAVPTAVDVRAFDPAGTLPAPGVTVIEASAGTGKTFTLTSLVVQAVCGGVPLGRILAVTFTRMATGELRDRVRDRMVTVHAQLQRHLSEGTAPSDPTAAVVAGGPPGAASAGLDRLADALADFDAATIATTHGFCQLVLRGLGTAGDAAPGTVLLEDPSDLVGEVVDDLYLRWTLGRPVPEFSAATARQAAIEATRHPGITVVPAEGSDPPALLGRLAARARREVAARLMAASHLTYDDLLYRLARTLSDPEQGPAACERLRSTWSLVLVDEFQDTDPVQWSILQLAFASPPSRLVLIGDPKQAIYSFRGADVHAYLDAAASAGTVYTLERNWRSDQPLLDATEALLSPLQFGHPGIPFRSVRAAAGDGSSGLSGAPAPTPMRFRLVADSQPGIAVTAAKKLHRKPDLSAWVAGDVAADVAALLASGATVPGPCGGRRLLEPADVAVLSRTNRQAVSVRDALRAAGVASVVAGLESVFGSEAADHWLTLLEGLQEPSSRSRAAAAALTPFVGMTAAEVAAAGERRWESVHDRLNRWATTLAGRGVATLWQTVAAEESVPGRVLATEGGERLLTDLGHVAQLLHSESRSGRSGAAGLRSWLAARMRTVDEDQSEADERSRRLDSDAAAVQVLTVHRAKGLEFGVVYCPYLWDAGFEAASGPVVFHDPGAGGARTLDVGCPGDDPAARRAYTAHAAAARAERRGEDLRLLYVALTRARHQVVIWWGRAQDSRHSPLARILLHRDGDGAVGDARSGEPGAAQIRTALQAVAGRAPGRIALEVATGSGAAGALAVPAGLGPAPGSGPASGPDGPDGPAGLRDPATLAVADFDRSLDRQWRRASFTSITAAAHELGDGPVGSEPEEAGVGDEPAAGSGGPGADPAALPGGPAGPGGRPGPAGTTGAPERGHGPARPVPLADLPGGTATGTYVHRVLERCDFAAADLDGSIAAAVTSAARGEGPIGDPAVLVEGLRAALTTPLGPLLPGTRLADIARPDRLDELGFELPVAGGDRPTGTVDTAAIAGLLRRHLDGTGVLAGYPDRLADPVLATELRGYLTGSLDLVFRRSGADGETRWYVADYKTNRLAAAGLLTADAYRPAALQEEMQRRHYPLQALIYCVALHRYLRWRQPGYRPERHLGGVLYLFVRGMTGPAAPVVDGQPCGVYSWAVPPDLVVELSALFDRGRPAGAA